MPVEAVQRSIEDDRSSEYRLHPHGTIAHVLVPQLQRAAVVVIPILVEVDQQVEPPLQAKAFMDVEVGMDPKVPAALRFVQPAAFEMGVGDETLDAGKFFEE